MKKTIMYKYLGTNGVLETPIQLEGIYSIKYYILEADSGNILTDGNKEVSQIKIPESELKNWIEVSVGQE